MKISGVTWSGGSRSCKHETLRVENPAGNIAIYPTGSPAGIQVRPSTFNNGPLRRVIECGYSPARYDLEASGLVTVTFNLMNAMVAGFMYGNCDDLDPAQTEIFETVSLTPRGETVLAHEDRVLARRKATYIPRRQTVICKECGATSHMKM
jgi:hypothetical protein